MIQGVREVPDGDIVIFVARKLSTDKSDCTFEVAGVGGKYGAWHTVSSALCGDMNDIPQLAAMLRSEPA